MAGVAALHSPRTAITDFAAATRAYAADVVAAGGQVAREGYRRTDLRWRDLSDAVRWPGFRKLAQQHWRMGLEEMAGSTSRALFVRRAQRYVPLLRSSDVVPAHAGVRAQAVDRDGGLVDDFRIHDRERVTAVRNAPSPAATSSMAIAEHVVGQVSWRPAAS